MTTATRDWWRSDDFKNFLPHLNATAAGDKRHYASPRFDLKSNTPWTVTRAALDYRAACVACGALMAPFRQRKGDSSTYFAVTCTQERNNACSRGRRAADAYQQIWQLVKDTGPHQGGLL